jgi:hypothetical protein
VQQHHFNPFVPVPKMSQNIHYLFSPNVKVKYHPNKKHSFDSPRAKCRENHGEKGQGTETYSNGVFQVALDDVLTVDLRDE